MFKTIVLVLYVSTASKLYPYLQAVASSYVQLFATLIF